MRQDVVTAIERLRVAMDAAEQVAGQPPAPEPIWVIEHWHPARPMVCPRCGMSVDALESLDVIGRGIIQLRYMPCDCTCERRRRDGEEDTAMAAPGPMWPDLEDEDDEWEWEAAPCTP